jgi:nitrogen fixation NifU-like protein
MYENKELKNYADALQEQIMQQMRKLYSEAVIERWQNPRNVGKIENPDGYGKVKGECGDTMEFFLKIEKNKISECTFMTDGCGTSMAAGSMATEIAKNKTFTEALAIVSAEEILKQLGGLPQDSVVTVPMILVVIKASAVNVSNITGACRNYLPAFSRMKWKKPLTALCAGS